MNADSRDSAASKRPSLLNTSLRHASSVNEPSNTSPRKVRKKGPIGLCVKACTLASTPLRVRNVPSTVSRKVETINVMVQVFSIPRRSCTITECRNAVAVSHGMKDAFSTGSQAQ